MDLGEMDLGDWEMDLGDYEPRRKAENEGAQKFSCCRSPQILEKRHLAYIN